MAAATPTREQLNDRISRLLASVVAFKGTVYRSSTPEYANKTDLLTGEGIKRNGGRRNPPGIAAVYASLSPETAMAEALAHYRYYSIPIENAMPRTFVAMATNLRHLIDFRDRHVQRRLQIALKRILGADWRKEASGGREPITQMLGRAAAAAGLERFLVPSAADPHGNNLIVFPNNVRPSSAIRVLHEGRLAR